MPDCIFCQMVAGSIPVKKIYEDEAVFVIHDIHPKAKVHVLVIPKQHVATFNDLAPEHCTVMTNVAIAIAQITEQLGIAQSGYKVVINNGNDGGQAIPHLHCHVLGGERIAGVT